MALGTYRAEDVHRDGNVFNLTLFFLCVSHIAQKKVKKVGNFPLGSIFFLVKLHKITRKFTCRQLNCANQLYLFVLHEFR